MRNSPSPRSQRFLKSIGKKLSHARNVGNIPLQKAAADLNISPTRLQSIERGEKNYSLKLLVEMCNYYKLDVVKICDL